MSYITRRRRPVSITSSPEFSNERPSPGRPPVAGCALCPRLAAFRADNHRLHPDWHNAPVPSFGGTAARLLVVGLAPGLRGANRTGRPFTGDGAGELLYAGLAASGFARGDYAARADDGLELVATRITNAVRCVPPKNRPNAAEINTCRRFLAAEISGLPALEAIFALGTIAHRSALAALGEPAGAYPFRHGAMHSLNNGLVLADSYHCSRYNINTRRLSAAMFLHVCTALRHRLDG